MTQGLQRPWSDWRSKGEGCELDQNRVILSTGTMESPKSILEKLEARHFEALIGVAENEWLDAKEKPYHLDSKRQKHELAKDVAAFANAGGGLILIGFDCEKEPTTSSERICRVCPFPVSLVDPNRYNQILADLVHPPPHGVSARVFEAADSQGVAAIVVDAAMATDRPYLVGKMLDESDGSLGAYFGYFERKRDVIPPVSIARIQQQLSAGVQWSSIDQRLQAIEANFATWGKGAPAARTSSISDKVRKERISAARVAVGRNDSPLVYYTASAEGDCDFPTLFKSRSERIVRLVETPPQLREQGFEIWAGDYSEILLGRLRRNVITGHRLIDLWKDGLFVFIAPGDEAFLGWRMGGEDRPIHISNFVLAESVLVFCWLMNFVFAEADPKPPVIRLAVGFDNLRRPSGLPTLSRAPEGPMRFQGETKIAPDGTVEVSQLAETVSYDPEQLAYLLLAKIFNWFGFESTSVPYVEPNRSELRLNSASIIGKALPETLPFSENF